MGNCISTLCGSKGDYYEPICEKRPLLIEHVADRVCIGRAEMLYSQPAAIARKAIMALIDGNEKPLRQLNRQLADGEVRSSSWAGSIAEGIFNGLVEALQPGQPIGDALKATYERVHDAAMRTFKFAEDHPYITIGVTMIIALAILMLIAPWVISVLGFTEEGVVARSWAAAWQSTYGGVIEEGSLFAWLQRIGAKGLEGLLPK